jgi:putative transposase
MTPAMVHYGQAAELTVRRQAVLAAAYEKHSERFVQGQPVAPRSPTAVWINPPLEKDGESSP